MNILSKLLEKKGLKPEDLTSEEKGTIEQWKKTLSEGEITIDTILMFCNNNISYIENQFKDLNNTKEKLERLVLLYSVYSSLRNIINSPKTERESLENYLTTLLK